MRRDRIAVAALASGAALVVGGGTALADHGESKRAERCQDRLARIAERRGVSVDQLQARRDARLTARVEAALAAGRISPERAARLKERISEQEACRRPGVTIRIAAGAGIFRAAARYLGLAPGELRAELSGTSPGALAEKHGKSVDGLKAAMLTPAKTRLERAVEAGRISRARADRTLARLAMLVNRLVATTFPAK
jgi:hypothetical protein